jgi:FAD/FMN-containing dehydrogenase
MCRRFVCPESPAEQVAVVVARQHHLPLSVCGGGHDWAGRSLRHGGLVIDLSRMRRVAVDPQLRVATVQGGATAGDVIVAAQPHGLSAATGTTGGVGMAGLTLGGGYGPLNGRFGLALDNLLSAEVVLADGSRLTANPKYEPELYWALRGGGGNFGVVTSLRVRLHPDPELLAGFIIYPWSQAADVWKGLNDLLADGPDELTPTSPSAAAVLFTSTITNGPSTVI